MLSLIRIIKQIPLVRRITTIALLFAAVLTAAALFFINLALFQTTSNHVSNCLTSRIDQYYPELSENIWKRETREVDAIFVSIEQQCHVVVHKPGQFHWLLTLNEDANWFARGDNLLRWPGITLQFPLSYWEGRGIGQYGIGELTVRVSLRDYYDDLLWKGWLTYSLLLLILIFSCLLAMMLGYRWFVERSQAFVENALKGDIDESFQRSIAEERTEITELWGVILRLRSDFEQRLDDANTQIHQLKQDKNSAESDLAAKNTMVATLSHELRTPMNGLIGFSSLLAETPLQQVQQEYVSTIQASLESLLYVINDVSDLVRFETGELQVDNIPFCIRSTISGISSLLRAKAESRGLRVETRVDPRVSMCLLGDPGRIRKLLSNLVFNAIEYTEEGQILLNIDVISEDGERCLLRLSVEDSGLPLERRWSTLSRPELPEESAHSHFKLDASERLAQLLGTEIQYKAIGSKGEDKEGVAAWLDLEFQIPPARDGSSVVDRTALEKVQLVIVDGSELSRKITLELIEDWGVPVFVKNTIVDVLKFIPLCIEQRHTVVILDDAVEDYDVLTAVSQLRTLVANKGSVVIVSGSPSIGDGEKYFMAGANGYLVKADRDLFLKDIICQVYAERDFSVGRNKRLVTRYTVGGNAEHIAGSEAINLRALLIEGNIVNQQFLARELEKRGCLIDIATNGFEALELFKHHTYQLIMVDCWLEDMNGYETAQLFRDLEASRGGFYTPIIALATGDYASESERCKRAGMDEVLLKPLNLSHLEMVLEQYLD